MPSPQQSGVSLQFATLSRPELFCSLIVGAGAATYPLGVEGTLKWMIETDPLPPLNGREVVEGFLGSIHGYTAPRFVREDYLASYEGDRLTRSAALVRQAQSEADQLALERIKAAGVAHVAAPGIPEAAVARGELPASQT